MKYENVHSLTWGNADHTILNVTVSFDGVGEVPFSARADDAEEHGREIFSRAASGEFGAISDYVAPRLTQAEIIATYEKELDKYLDDTAIAYRFGVNSTMAPRHALAIRAGYPNEWRELAVAFGTWMDAENIKASALLQSALDGERDAPSMDEFRATFSKFTQ